VDLLADAFLELAQTQPDARLLIIGSGDEDSSIRAILARETARGRVHIEPGMPHELLPMWYRAMDLLVMPSRYENFSNAMIEGMACGLPCLSSDIGGNRIVAKTGAGWLFEAKSVLALASCLKTALKDRHEMRARGELARLFVRGRYSWKASAASLEQVISSRLGISA
jgi:glycosyltransferase involved in cell wall biosynthesis